MFSRTVGSCALIVCTALPRMVFAQRPDSLRLSDVYRELRAQNPRLQAATAFVEAERAKEPGAGLPPDPEVRIGMMDFALPGFSADMATSMAPSIQAMQMLPIPGKLSMGRTIARQSTAIARSQADEVWWEIRAQAAMAFYELYQSDRQLAVMQETLELLRRFHKVAQAMYSAGEGRQADVLRASVEIARMQADITRMQTMRTVDAAKLNALLLRPANTPVGQTTDAVQPLAMPSADVLIDWAEASRPMLAAGRLSVERAQARQALARREIWPDITLGLGYGRRPTDMGTEHMGSAMIGFSVPVFAKQRQLRMREEANAMTQMAEADLTQMRAMVNARVAELLAEIERAQTLIALYTRDVLPQARATVESSFSSYRVGAVDFMTLLDAQMTTNSYRQELVALEAQHGSALAELEMTIGRELQTNAQSDGR